MLGVLGTMLMVGAVERCTLARRKPLAPGGLSVFHLLNQTSQATRALRVAVDLLRYNFSSKCTPFIATEVNVDGHGAVGEARMPAIIDRRWVAKTKCYLLGLLGLRIDMAEQLGVFHNQQL